MSQKQLRGPEGRHEIRSSDLIRDARPISRKISDWLKSPQNLATLLVFFALLAFILPAIAHLCLISSLIFTWFGMRQGETSPLKLPIQSGMMDTNERHPATSQPSIAQGIFFLGNELKTGKEVWLTNSDCRQHFLVLGTTGAGKALPLNAEVHTPSGWKKMGDLKINDLVSTPDGEEARVVGYYPQGEIDICKITFYDGRSAEACPEHLWEVYTEQFDGESESKTSVRLMRTKEISSLLNDGNTVLKIRLPEPVEKPEAELPIDPYLLGGMISSGVMQVGFHSELDEIGLLNVSAHELFIPYPYKNGSVIQRQEVIRGLMDVSGTFDTQSGVAYFSSASEHLARDFQEIVWSLGGMATIKSTADGANEWIVEAVHKTPVLFFSALGVTKKSGGWHQCEQGLKLQIMSVEVVRTDEAACILIDHPEHLFITNNYVVTHNTEALLGFAANAVAWGSGFLFCDGKGDVALFSKVYALCRRFGREDDLLVLNYMTGNQDVGGGGGKLMSNTLNPFATGSSDTLTQMVVGLMDDAGGDGAMWKGRATAMFTGVMRALTWLRDNNFIDLNVSEIRDHLQLKRIIDLADKDKYPDMPPPIRKSILSYMTSLPGFQEDKGYKQSQTTLDQHGYLEMQFTKILGSLADVYGHIFHTPYGEIDMADVVLNRRILVIMLPALEKSRDEIANLGKIVVATLKGMMGGTLGSEIEGSWDSVVDNRPTNSPSPFIVVLDEVGYYMVDGMDLMAAQARSLGFSLIFAGQDINAMKSLNEKVFGSVRGNTNTKIIMRTEDEDTAELAVKAAGKMFLARMKSYQGKSKEIGGRSYSDDMSAGAEEVDRINPLDLKDQDEGEMHIIHKGWVVRAKSFYANPDGSVNKKNLKLRANYFITVAKPDREEIENQQKLPEIIAKMADPEFARQIKIDAVNAMQDLSPDNDIGLAAHALKKVRASKRVPSNMTDTSCIVYAMLNEENKKVSQVYAHQIQASAGLERVGEDSFIPRNSEDIPFDIESRSVRRPPVQRQAPTPLDEIEERSAPIASKPRPIHNSMKSNIPHGTEVGGEIQKMTDRMSTNENVLKTLRALNFDEKVETRESVDNYIEEALSGDFYEDDDDDFDFTKSDIATSAAASSAALFDDEEEEEQGDGSWNQNSAPVEDFLTSLLQDEDD